MKKNNIYKLEKVLKIRCDLCNKHSNKTISFKEQKTNKNRKLCFDCYQIDNETLKHKGFNKPTHIKI